MKKEHFIFTFHNIPAGVGNHGGNVFNTFLWSEMLHIYECVALHRTLYLFITVYLLNDAIVVYYRYEYLSNFIEVLEIVPHYYQMLCEGVSADLIYLSLIPGCLLSSMISRLKSGTLSTIHRKLHLLHHKLFFIYC